MAGATAQTALVGRLAPGGSTSLAALAAVAVTLRTTMLVFYSFFVDAGAARLSHHLGGGRPAAARSQAVQNQAVCVLLGAVTGAALLAGRRRLLLDLLRLSPLVAAEATPLWVVQALAMPATMANLAISGTLQVGRCLPACQACLCTCPNVWRLVGVRLWAWLRGFPVYYKIL